MNKNELKLDQQELQHLITVSTGFLDVFKVTCYDQKPMLLPQNIILSAQTCKTDVSTMQWHEKNLPIYAIHTPTLTEGVALVVEGEKVEERFILLCDAMPESIRLRISELADENEIESNDKVFQLVSFEQKIYQIPALDKIYQSIC